MSEGAGGADHDLSGHWTGIFNFPSLLPPGPFEAVIRDIAGAISGVTTEPGCMFDPPGTILDAVLDGSRDGALVAFRKIYSDELRPDVVHYQGHIQPGGDEIQGEWAIAGDWSGTFLMVRGSKAAAAAERRVGETV
jgi:hypothetical protein